MVQLYGYKIETTNKDKYCTSLDNTDIHSNLETIFMEHIFRSVVETLL